MERMSTTKNRVYGVKKKLHKIEPMVQTVAELPRTSFHSSSNILILKKYFLPLNGKWVFTS
jgi:hypothetical protein